MNAVDKVLLDYGMLAEGERKSGQVCPLCNGGSHKEKSFSVANNAGYLEFICFRASCPFKGRAALSGARRSSFVAGGKEPKVSEYVRARQLPPNVEEMLSAKYHVEPGMFEWARWRYTKSYKGHGPRVAMPILDPEGNVRGVNWRSYVGESPKAVIEKLKEQQEQMCWYRGHNHGTRLVIVEDQPSALRLASQGVDALALCGTLLTLNRIYEIKKQDYKQVYLCLDDDATNVAISHAVLFKARLPQLKILALDDDIKDMDDQNFELFLKELNTH